MVGKICPKTEFNPCLFRLLRLQEQKNYRNNFLVKKHFSYSSKTKPR